eukprot:PITA_05280
MAANNTQLVRSVSTNDELCKISATVLTVWKKSPMFNCNGFTVFDLSGNLVFRVESYIGSIPKHQVVLMDAAGIPLLTMQRRKRPFFTMRKPVSLLPTKTLAEVCAGSPAKHRKWKLQSEYLHIEGCYSKRSFNFHDSSGDIIAEVKPKQVRSGVTLGGDVFSLIVHPGYDPAFFMGLIIVLDQLMPSQ